MKCELKHSAVLTLDIKTTQWLKSVMQNPLHNISPSDEDPQDAVIRRELFEGLKSVTDQLDRFNENCTNNDFTRM